MRIAVITTCAAMLLVLPELQDPVYAYLDPGTGSMVIQAVVAGGGRSGPGLHRHFLMIAS